MNEPYKILLVDDEAEVRTSIIRKIDWSAGMYVSCGRSAYLRRSLPAL